MVKIIQPGEMVGYIVLAESSLAEVLGTVRSGAQYMLMIRIEEEDPETGKLKPTRRLFQRDRNYINSLNPTARCLRGDPNGPV